MVLHLSHPLAALWQLYVIVVLIRCVLSFTGGGPESSGLARFVYRATEPVLAPLRRVAPPERTGHIDFSPLLLFVLGNLLVPAVITLLPF